MPIRKHKGIVQTGGKAGKLKKGYKYSGKKLKSGLAQIVKATKTTKIGGKAIGKGQYGCIMSPPIKCKSSKEDKFDYKNKVSKVSLKGWIPGITNPNEMKYMISSGKNEYHMGKRLLDMDPNMDHFFGIQKICTIRADQTQDIIDLNSKKINPEKKCFELIKSPKDRIHSNLLMGKADVPMEHAFTPDIDPKIAVDAIAKIILKSCESMKILKKNNYMHLDFKAPNAMIIKKQKKMESIMIDFDERFMPNSPLSLIETVLDYNGIVYLWAPEVWLIGYWRGDKDIKKNLEKAVIQVTKQWGYDIKWTQDYFKKSWKNDDAWRDFVDKAMVYQIAYGLFSYGISHRDCDQRKIYGADYPYDYPANGGSKEIIPGFFSTTIEYLLYSTTKGKLIRKVMQKMVTFNANDRLTLKQTQQEIQKIMGYPNISNWLFTDLKSKPPSRPLPPSPPSPVKINKYIDKTDKTDNKNG